MIILLTPTMLPAGSIVGALYHKLYTQSSAPEDGRNYRPKYVEVIEIVNKIIIVASTWLFIVFYHYNYFKNHIGLKGPNKG